MVKQLTTLVFIAIFCCCLNAQNVIKASKETKGNGTGSVFHPISKYIQRGSVECLSAWFHENIRIDILGGVSNCSKQQAKQILREFFNSYPPRSFEFIYNSGEYPMEYAVGNLDSGGNVFAVTVLVSSDSTGNYIQHLKIGYNCQKWLVKPQVIY